MNVLVTGSRGFVGAAVCRELSRLGHVAESLTGDVRDPGCYPLRQFDAVIHLASLISHRSEYSAQQLFDVNVTGTERLLAGYPWAHFVYVSTADVARAQLSDYARSKLEAEKQVGLHPSYCIVRLTSVFGPGQRQQSKLIPRLLRKYVLHEPGPELTDEARPCLYVEDAAEAVCAGITQHGIVTVAGTLVHNRDLDRLVAAASRDESPETVAADQQALFLHLRECVDYLRRRNVL